MKTLLICCLLLFSAPVFAQSGPVKGANQIQVQLPDSGVVAWKRVAQVLSSRGYGIKASDKDLLTISTDARRIKRAGDVTLSAAVQGTRVILSGGFSNGVGATSERIAYRGMKGSPFMAAWEELEAVSRELGGTSTYKAQP